MEIIPKWKQVLGSRKFWAAVVGAVMVAVRVYVPDFSLSDEQVIGVVVVMVGYIMGTALEDGMRGGGR